MAMSGRITMGVPINLKQQLEALAVAEERPVASLCRIILEKAVREAVEAGRIPPLDDAQG